VAAAGCQLSEFRVQSSEKRRAEKGGGRGLERWNHKFGLRPFAGATEATKREGRDEHI